MIKKTLITGLVALTAGCASGSSKLAVRFNDVYCLRRTIVAENAENEKVYNMDSYGTTFIAGNTDTETLLTTAAHVVFAPIDEPPTGFRLSRIYYTLVDNEYDTDLTDDKPLRVVGATESDIALLAYDGKIPYEPQTFCEKTYLGDPNIIMGYFLGVSKIVSKGIISSNAIEFENMVGIMSDNSVSSGMSGSPSYAIQDGGECLDGVAIGFTGDNQFAVISPVENLENLLNSYNTSPEELKAKLRLINEKAYTYQTTVGHDDLFNVIGGNDGN